MSLPGTSSGRKSLVEQAHLRSEAELAARAFFMATPSGACHMEGAAFPIELRVRLGVPDARIVGERTQRHHSGLTARVCALRKSPASCFHNALMTHLWGEDARQMFTVPPWLGNLLRLTSPLRLHSNRKPWLWRLRQLGQLLLPTQPTKTNTSTLVLNGVTFVPMGVETTGAWEAAAAKVLKHIWSTRVPQPLAARALRYGPLLARQGGPATPLRGCHVSLSTWATLVDHF
eukprot:s20_g25.t1